jgi:hypothetical protein
MKHTRKKAIAVELLILLLNIGILSFFLEHRSIM